VLAWLHVVSAQMWPTVHRLHHACLKYQCWFCCPSVSNVCVILDRYIRFRVTGKGRIWCNMFLSEASIVAVLCLCLQIKKVLFTASIWRLHNKIFVSGTGTEAGKCRWHPINSCRGGTSIPFYQASAGRPTGTETCSVFCCKSDHYLWSLLTNETIEFNEFWLSSL
jgi:hypothetical protein